MKKFHCPLLTLTSQDLRQDFLMFGQRVDVEDGTIAATTFSDDNGAAVSTFPKVVNSYYNFYINGV